MSFFMNPSFLFQRPIPVPLHFRLFMLQTLFLTIPLLHFLFFPTPACCSSISPAHSLAHVPCSRHSSLLSKPPIWSHDFVCPTIRSSGSSAYPISNYVSYSHLSPSLQAFSYSISQVKEPSSYHEAVGDPRWQSAMDAEITSLEANKTWEIVSLTPGKSVIWNKWVYKVKYHPNGAVDRFKVDLWLRVIPKFQGSIVMIIFLQWPRLAWSVIC